MRRGSGVWAAISSGDLALLKIAPDEFDFNSTSDKHGTVPSAFVQKLATASGRFPICAEERVVRASELTR